MGTVSAFPRRVVDPCGTLKPPRHSVFTARLAVRIRRIINGEVWSLPRWSVNGPEGGARCPPYLYERAPQGTDRIARTSRNARLCRGSIRAILPNVTARKSDVIDRNRKYRPALPTPQEYPLLRVFYPVYTRCGRCRRCIGDYPRSPPGTDVAWQGAVRAPVAYP